MDYPCVAKATKYARDVLDGKIQSCKFVQLACQRHVDDLQRSKVDKDYPFYFDPAQGERFLQFAQNLPHVKGKWALHGELLDLEPWQCFLGACLFGWLQRADDFRRFREVYWEIARKSGKSVFAAAVGLYCFTSDYETGGEVYCGATTEKQAWEVFRPARLMLKKSPDLIEACGAEIYAKSLVIESDYSRFEPMIGNPGDGPSPSCAIIDEYHEHATSAMYDTMVTGQGARDQPLLLIITTAGYNLAGPCYERRRIAVQMLTGVIPDDQLFAVIYTIDEKDDWADPAVLPKANPNYGVSVNIETLLAHQRKAVLNASEQNKFKTKHLNVWGGARSPWFPIQQWISVTDAGLTPEELRGCECWFALDLASKSDMIAFVKLFKRRVNDADHFYPFARFYLPEAAVEEPGRNQGAYRRWEKRGLLTLTEGFTTDFDQVVEDVVGDAKIFNPEEVIFDPFNATHAAQKIAAAGVKEVIEFIQQPSNFAVPMDDIKGAIAEGRYHHDGNEILQWMIANVTIRPAKKGLFWPTKETQDDKIDGAVAMIMAHARATAAEAREPGIESWLASPTRG